MSAQPANHDDPMARWEPVIGLEIHVQLSTHSKLFSGSSTAYGAEPNTQANEVDVALPGTLPVPNRDAIRKAILFGLAIDAEIARESIFARKNYFYPDSPKGYQISQYEQPIVANGHLEVRVGDRTLDIEIVRAHLEEDAGKSIHDAFHGKTGIDLNRAGVPLIEVVSAPVMHSPEEAVAYLREVHRLVRWLGICDGNLQEGSFRCDANVSVRPRGETKLGTRVEIKNVNSFRFVEKAIAYEIERQVRALEGGGSLVQETRLYDEAHDRTRTMRSKESEQDYRYFPDPDLPPLRLSEAEIDAIRATLPELPEERRARYLGELKLPAYDAEQLTADRGVSDYFEAVVAALPDQPKLAANWVLGELAAACNDAAIEVAQSPVRPASLAALVAKIVDGTINGKTAKDVFAAMWAGEGEPAAIIAAKGLGQISDDSALVAAIDAVLAAHPAQVRQFREGDDKVLTWFVGQIMKQTRGKANPQRLNALLVERLRASP